MYGYIVLHNDNKRKIDELFVCIIRAMDFIHMNNL